MAQQQISILAIDDDPDHLTLLEMTASKLTRISVHFDGESDPSQALTRILVSDHDVYVIDHHLGSVTGLEIIGDATAARHHGPFILLTSAREEDLDVEAVRAGAVDYLRKQDLTTESLERALLLALERSASLEAERLAADAAKQALEAKGEFLATVTHELRTPLANVIGLAQILLDTDGDFPAEERRRMLAGIVDEGHELAGLVDDLLASARNELGRLHVVSVPVDLAAQVRQVLEMFSDDRRGRVDEQLSPAPAIGDPGRIRQVFRNLVDNAMKYGGDEIVVTTRTIGGNAVLEVADDGMGLPGGTDDAVFERHNPNVAVGTSNGIGLSLARDLAELMEGSLRYERIDGWTRFTLELPAGGA